MRVKSEFKTLENVNEFHVLRLGNEYLESIDVDYYEGWLDFKSTKDILKAHRFYEERMYYDKVSYVFKKSLK